MGFGGDTMQRKFPEVEVLGCWLISSYITALSTLSVKRQEEAGSQSTIRFKLPRFAPGKSGNTFHYPHSSRHSGNQGSKAERKDAIG